MWTFILLLIIGTVIGHVMRVIVNAAAAAGATVLRSASPAYSAGSDHLPSVLHALPEYTPREPRAEVVTTKPGIVPTTPTGITVEARIATLRSEVQNWIDTCWPGLKPGVVAAVTADDHVLLDTPVDTHSWEPRVLQAFVADAASESGVPLDIATSLSSIKDIATASASLCFRMKLGTLVAPVLAATKDRGYPVALIAAAITLVEAKDLGPQAAIKILATTQDSKLLTSLATPYGKDVEWLTLRLKAGV